MIKVKIQTKDGELNYGFPDQQSVDAWCNSKIAINAFGLSAYTQILSEEVPEIPEVPAVLDEQGNIVTPAIPAIPSVPAVTQDIPAEYSITYTEFNDYVNQRAKEYPDFRNYLDGIVKGDQAQMQAYIDACLAVKAKYPKS